MPNWNDIGNEYVHGLEREIAKLESEITTMRPWGALGKKSVRERWWAGGYADFGEVCLQCERGVIYKNGLPYHPDNTDCDIPILIAQLEKEDAAL